MLARIILILLLPTFVNAEVEMRFNDGSVGIVSDGRVMFGDDTNAVLYLPGDEGMIVIDSSQQTWMRLEPGFASKMAEQVQAQMNQMLASVPPEQRAMVEAQMKGMMPQMGQEAPQVNIRKTGKTDTVAGFDCAEAEVSFEGGGVEETVCIADADELGIADEDFDSLIAAMRGMAEIATLNPDAPPQADFGDIGGVPIRTTDRNYGNDSELVSVNTDNVDTARLEIPDGYREVSIEDMMRQ